MVRENESQAGFSSSVLFDPKLSLKAKALYLLIEELRGKLSLSSEILARTSSNSLKSIRSGLSELENGGYLMRKKSCDGFMEYIPSSSGKAVTS
jgi:hypothetical protein